MSEQKAAPVDVEAQVLILRNRMAVRVGEKYHEHAEMRTGGHTGTTQWTECPDKLCIEIREALK